ncbi:DUF6350 family protein [Microbacterium sp. C7(2022)]|uniref:cell division protein PerM n=1 Tax=Microbacterium sp. C7(2022) TaxID=2992759 RepID=UPI00237C3E57|nr:DUF6350 family protein [Microbacterium sp. C7(2022)]MDE0547472.1 DUF6350 family protein [Microbacterium sp. C7(2022)]
MNRLIVLLLAAIDAFVSVAVGIAVIVAPLTLLWVLALPGADWSALWPATGTIWQFGMLVPVAIDLPVEYIVSLGIDPAAAQFTLSLAPLAFAVFAGIFGARSGMRASQAGAWITGVVSGTVVVAALATLVALSSGNPVGSVSTWQAVAFPTLLYAVPAAGAAVVLEWRDAEGGVIADLRDRMQRLGDDWGDVVPLAARGTAIVLIGMLGAGALLVTAMLVLGLGDMVALYQAANVDALGAIVLTLAQGAYLPTLIVWGAAFIAGPGFSLGAGTVVSAAGSSAGIVPGIPILAVIPDDVNPWWLALVLIPVALGASAGWIARSQLVAARTRRRAEGFAAVPRDIEHEPMAARAVIAVSISVLSAAAAGLFAWFASGSIGPGRLEMLGPQPGHVALAIGVEVAVGASIMLLSPRGEAEVDELPRRATSQPQETAAQPHTTGAQSQTASVSAERAPAGTDDQMTAPLD